MKCRQAGTKMHWCCEVNEGEWSKVSFDYKFDSFDAICANLIHDGQIMLENALNVLAKKRLWILKSIEFVNQKKKEKSCDKRKENRDKWDLTKVNAKKRWDYDKCCRLREYRVKRPILMIRHNSIVTIDSKSNHFRFWQSTAQSIRWAVKTYGATAIYIHCYVMPCIRSATLTMHIDVQRNCVELWAINNRMYRVAILMDRNHE